MKDISIEDQATGLLRYIDKASEDSVVVHDALAQFAKGLKQVITSPDDDEASATLSEMRNGIFSTLDRIRRLNEKGTLRFSEGEEIWTTDGPATLDKLKHEKKHYFFTVKFATGKVSNHRTGTQIREILLDKAAHPDNYQKDKECCTAIATYYDDLKSDDLLINDLEPHIDWNIQDNSEPQKQLGRLDEQFSWNEAVEFTHKAKGNLRTVVSDAKNKRRLRNAIRNNLCSMRHHILSETISIDAAKIEACEMAAAPIANLCYSETYSELYEILQTAKSGDPNMA